MTITKVLSRLSHVEQSPDDDMEALRLASDGQHLQLGVFGDVEQPTLNEHVVHAQQVSQEPRPAKVAYLLRQFG